jgi:hypothetical protein
LGSSHRKDHGTGFLDELKDKAEDVIENVKDRVGGETPLRRTQVSATPQRQRRGQAKMSESSRLSARQKQK